jgi:hypothetical protein
MDQPLARAYSFVAFYHTNHWKNILNATESNKSVDNA